MTITIILVTNEIRSDLDVSSPKSSSPYRCRPFSPPPRHYWDRSEEREIWWDRDGETRFVLTTTVASDNQSVLSRKITVVIAGDWEIAWLREKWKLRLRWWCRWWWQRDGVEQGETTERVRRKGIKKKIEKRCIKLQWLMVSVLYLDFCVHLSFLKTI